MALQVKNPFFVPKNPNRLLSTSVNFPPSPQKNCSTFCELIFIYLPPVFWYFCFWDPSSNSFWVRYKKKECLALKKSFFLPFFEPKNKKTNTSGVTLPCTNHFCTNHFFNFLFLSLPSAVWYFFRNYPLKVLFFLDTGVC